jgi:hypothetical protein
VIFFPVGISQKQNRQQQEDLDFARRYGTPSAREARNSGRERDDDDDHDRGRERSR